MQDFIVTIVELLTLDVPVTADNQESAIALVKAQYKEEQHVLDSSNHYRTDFYAEEAA